MNTQTTAFNPATDNPSDPAGTLLPPTASHAAKSLSLFISGKPLLSDKTLSIYTRVIREGMDHQSYTLADWNAALGLDAENPLGDVVLRTLESRVSDNDAVLESSKTLETQLKEKFGAEGRGLHEYTSNVESALPENLVKTLRWIATRRNGIVHGEGDGFQDTQERARFVLQAARGWDWLANFESPVNEEQRLAAPSYRRYSLKIKMVHPILYMVSVATMFIGFSLAFITWSNLTLYSHWSNHPNQVDDFWLGVVLLALPMIILAISPKKERDFPLGETEKYNPPGKGKKGKPAA